MTEPRRKGVEVSAGGVPSAMAGPGIVLAALFLVFGVGFIGFVLSETSTSDEPGLAALLVGFGVLWVGACGVIIYGYARLRRSGANADPDSLLHIEEIDNGEGEVTAAPDFEARLRKVESLHRDGLLNDAEYRRKRAEILDEKW